MANKDIETYIEELKIISDRLSEGEATLAEAVELYKQGTDIANKAEKLLSQYEKEIEIINTQESGNDYDE